MRASDSKRSSPSLLARQLRLRLVADDDSDIPRSLHNIVVSIHAIATFQALHDYLRPRVSALLSGGSRLSGMFAALATSGLGPGSISRMTTEEPRQLTSTRNAAVPSAEAGVTVASSTVTRRRSQRLSAKKGSSDTGNHADSTAAPEAILSRTVPPDALLPEPPMRYPSALATSGPEAALSENLVHDSGFIDEFTDEIDAEVCFYLFRKIWLTDAFPRFSTKKWILTIQYQKKPSLCLLWKVSNNANL